MGYSEKLLSDDEVVVSEFRPHWSRILKEILLVFLTLALVVILGVVGAHPWIIIAVLALTVVLIARGLIKWLFTQHVITNERVIFREGFYAKSGKEIPLEVINDVAFTQSAYERFFGTGNLLIESAGTHGQSRYSDIPDPETVQSLIYQVREERMRGIEGPGVEGGGESRASQLAVLSRLHDEGKLTDEEFRAEKAKLLGGA
jgi:membrane protein YdbS with pleckstrin-like domain